MIVCILCVVFSAFFCIGWLLALANYEFIVSLIMAVPIIYVVFYLYSWFYMAKNSIDLHYIAQREESGRYPILTITGERLKDRNGVYFMRGCEVEHPLFKGKVTGLAEGEYPIGKWRLVIAIDNSIPLTMGIQNLTITSGGMTEEEWSKIKHQVPPATRGVFRI